MGEDFTASAEYGELVNRIFKLENKLAVLLQILEQTGVLNSIELKEIDEAY